MNVRLEGLQVGYSDRSLMKATDLSFDSGGLHFIIGRNGAGKSTLLRTMAGLQKPLEGKVLVNGEPIFTKTEKERAQAVYYLSGRNELRSRITVSEFLRIGVGGLSSFMNRKSIWETQLGEAAEEVGISDLLTSNIRNLSDGEFQKMMIALVLLRNPSVLLLDEPLSHLDPPSQIETLNLLAKLSIDRTVIISSHHLSALRSWASRVFILNASQELQELPDLVAMDEEQILSLYQ